MANLPLELFYQIALHLPSTNDVLTFALTHSRVRKALSTPALFMERLALQGWDVGAWQDEASNAAAGAQSPRGDLDRWMRIDRIYSRTVQLFDEAATDNYFSESPPDVDFDSDSEPEESGSGAFDDIVMTQYSVQGPVLQNPLLGGKKTMAWLRKLSEVLPAFLTHHRGGNVLRITEARHRSTLLTYAKFLSSMCAVVTPRLTVRGFPRSQIFKPRLTSSEYAWFERTSFCLIALLIQCDTNTVTSIFSNNVVYTDSPFSAFGSFWATDNAYFYPADLDPYTLPIAIEKARQLRVSERYFSTFLIQAMISMTLRSSNTSLRSSAPSLPYINPAASFSYDEPFEPQQDATTFSFPSPPPRPWLRNRLAGTPLADLFSSAGGGGDSRDGGRGRRHWAGYYTIGSNGTGLDPPMILELYSSGGPTAAPPSATEFNRLECMYFEGEGHDDVGTFTLKGSCNIHTGAMAATKAYAMQSWIWRGMVTPFGMAGSWGLGSGNGWWWIWPQEWSNDPATGSD